MRPAGPVFSMREARDIVLSLIVLTIVFSYPIFINNPQFLLVSMLTVGIGFIGHELSHKFVARKYGYFAEYQMWPQGLLLAVLFTVTLGVVFAAPGAVVFSALAFKRPHRHEVGKIGISGPMFNLALGIAFLGFALAYPFPILSFGALVNGWLAFFNLIPFGPLDGKKVFDWNKAVWAGAIVSAVAIFSISIQTMGGSLI